MFKRLSSMLGTRRGKILGTNGFAHFIHDGFTDTIYVLLPLWASGLQLNHAQVGLLKACLSGGLTFLQVPAGYLAERIGERLVLTLGTALAGAGFIGLAFADGFSMLAVCLFIAGIGCSTQHPLASALVSKAFEDGGRRAALGAYNFSGDLGKIAVPATVAAVAATIGWREGVMLYGIIGLGAAVCLYVLLTRLGAGGDAGNAAQTDAPAMAAGNGWGIRDRRGFSALAAIGVIDTGTRLGLLTFLPFLLINKGAQTETVGFALALVFAGGAAGKLICGLAAERMGILRTVVMTELATTCLIAGVIALPLYPALAALPVLGVALNGTSSVLYGTVGDFVDSHRQARAFGLFYTLGTGAGMTSPFIFGIISDLYGLETAVAVLAATVMLALPLCLALRPSLAAVAAGE